MEVEVPDSGRADDFVFSAWTRKILSNSEVLTGRSLSGMSHVPGAVDSEDLSSSTSAHDFFVVTSPKPVGPSLKLLAERMTPLQTVQRFNYNTSKVTPQ